MVHSPSEVTRVGKPMSAYRHIDPNGAPFRCERCDRVFPISDQMVWQDGYRLCRDYCADLMSGTEVDLAVASYESVKDSYSPVPYGLTAPLVSVPTVTSMEDASGNTVDQVNPIQINNGGANVVLKLNGVNLSSSDTIAYGDAGITDASAVAYNAGGTLCTLTLTASGATPGETSLTYNGVVYRDRLRIR